MEACELSKVNSSELGHVKETVGEIKETSKRIFNKIDEMTGVMNKVSEGQAIYHDRQEAYLGRVERLEKKSVILDKGHNDLKESISIISSSLNTHKGLIVFILSAIIISAFAIIRGNLMEKRESVKELRGMVAQEISDYLRYKDVSETINFTKEK